MDAIKAERFNQLKDFLAFTGVSLVVISSNFMEDTPSDKIKNEIMTNGTTVIDTLMEELDENIDSIELDELVDIKNRETALEVEDMLVNLCDKLVGHRSTLQLFAALSASEIILRNLDEIR